MAAGAGTLAFTGAMLAAGFGGAGDARADALCDQMRAQYGPSWPCISVPTYTPPPTMNAPTTTPGAPGTSSGGAVIGGDAGPRPGTGNGTPIVGGPSVTGEPSPRSAQPGSTRDGPSPTNHGSTSERPSTTPARKTSADDPRVPARANLSDQRSNALVGPSGNRGAVPITVWALAGAAAVAVANPRTRSFLRTTSIKNNVDAYSGQSAQLGKLGPSADRILSCDAPGANVGQRSPGYITTVSQPPLETTPGYKPGPTSGDEVSIDPNLPGNTGPWGVVSKFDGASHETPPLTLERQYRARIVGARPVFNGSAPGPGGKQYIAITWELQYEIQSASIANVTNGGGTSKFPGGWGQWERATPDQISFLRSQGVIIPG